MLSLRQYMYKCDCILSIVTQRKKKCFRNFFDVLVCRALNRVCDTLTLLTEITMKMEFVIKSSASLKRQRQIIIFLHIHGAIKVSDGNFFVRMKKKIDKNNFIIISIWPFTVYI